MVEPNVTKHVHYTTRQGGHFEDESMAYKHLAVRLFSSHLRRLQWLGGPGTRHWDRYIWSNNRFHTVTNRLARWLRWHDRITYGQ